MTGVRGYPCNDKMLIMVGKIAHEASLLENQCENYLRLVIGIKEQDVLKFVLGGISTGKIREALFKLLRGRYSGSPELADTIAQIHKDIQGVTSHRNDLFHSTWGGAIFSKDITMGPAEIILGSGDNIGKSKRIRFTLKNATDLNDEYFELNQRMLTLMEKTGHITISRVTMD